MKKITMQKVDKLASEYIRRKYSDKNEYVKCCTCGNIKHWKDMDCGHFIKRDVLILRYDERNMHPQCRKCNHFNSGMLDEYSKFIISKYGLKGQKC